MELVNAEYDERRTTVDMRLADEERKPDKYWLREFVLLGDRCIGETSCQERTYQAAVPPYGIGLSLLPGYRDRGFEVEILDRQLEKVKALGAGTVTTGGPRCASLSP